MRRTISMLTVLAVVVGLALAMAACGSSGSGSSASTKPAPSPTLSAQELVKQSEAATAKQKSGSLTADLGVKVKGDTSKMDPTAQAMIGQGVTLHVQGKSSQSPAAADMTMSLGFAGQNLEFAMKAQGGKAWIEYQGKWYELDQKTAKSLGGQTQSGSSPTQQLKSMGVDPAAWGTTYTYVGAEDMGGTQVYHVKATVDPQKMAASMLKALTSQALQKQLGQNSTGKQLEQQLKQSKAQLRQLRKSFKSASADFYIGASDMLMRKVAMAVEMDMSGQKGTQGITLLGITGAVTLSDFGATVTVTPPANALPFNQLMNSLFGGMLGGTGSMSF